MSVPSWIVLGLIAGFIASNIVNRSGQGLLLDIVLGIIGAVVGGFLFSAIGATGITGINLWSILFAIFGATRYVATNALTMPRIVCPYRE